MIMRLNKARTQERLKRLLKKKNKEEKSSMAICQKKKENKRLKRKIVKKEKIKFPNMLKKPLKTKAKNDLLFFNIHFSQSNFN